MYIAMKALSVPARYYYGRWVSSMYIAMKARSVPARYYYGRRLSLRKQEGMDGGCGHVSYIIVPPDLN